MSFTLSKQVDCTQNLIMLSLLALVRILSRYYINLQNLSCPSDYFKATGSSLHLPLRDPCDSHLTRHDIFGEVERPFLVLIKVLTRRSCCHSKGSSVKWPQPGSA